MKWLFLYFICSFPIPCIGNGASSSGVESNEDEKLEEKYAKKYHGMTGNQIAEYEILNDEEWDFGHKHASVKKRMDAIEKRLEDQRAEERHLDKILRKTVPADSVPFQPELPFFGRDENLFLTTEKDKPTAARETRKIGEIVTDGILNMLLEEHVGYEAPKSPISAKQKKSLFHFGRVDSMESKGEEEEAPHQEHDETASNDGVPHQFIRSHSMDEGTTRGKALPSPKHLAISHPASAQHSPESIHQFDEAIPSSPEQFHKLQNPPADSSQSAESNASSQPGTPHTHFPPPRSPKAGPKWETRQPSRVKSLPLKPDQEKLGKERRSKSIEMGKIGEESLKPRKQGHLVNGKLDKARIIEQMREHRKLLRNLSILQKRPKRRMQQEGEGEEAVHMHLPENGLKKGEEAVGLEQSDQLITEAEQGKSVLNTGEQNNGKSDGDNASPAMPIRKLKSIGKAIHFIRKMVRRGAGLKAEKSGSKKFENANA